MKPNSGRGATAIIFILALVGVVAYVVTRGINERVASANAVRVETAKVAVPTVSVISPRQGSMQNEIVLPGNVQAFKDAPIYARASGYLKKWYVDIGGKVKAGQLLADIDAPEMDQQVRQSQASLEQAKATLEQATANYEQGRSNEQLAKLTATRWNSLVEKGAVSRQDNDQYQAQYQAQEANLRALEKAVSAARSNVAAIEADVARLTSLQSYTQVRAPFDGVVTARNTDIGALVNAGNGGAAQELFHIAAVSPLRVYVNVPEASSRGAVPGVPAALTLAEFPGRQFPGKIVRVAGAMDASSRTLLTEVEVNNDAGTLLPGSYAQVHLKLAAGAPSLIVPVAAILFRGDGQRVGVVRDANKADLATVVVGKDYGTEVEILSGLSPGDRVIENPPDSLVAGMEVRVVQPKK